MASQATHPLRVEVEFHPGFFRRLWLVRWLLGVFLIVVPVRRA